MRSVKVMSQLLTILVGTLIVSVTNMPNANASSGGGCANDQETGDTIRACISASGDHLEPDFYLLNAANCDYTVAYVGDQTTGGVLWEDGYVNDGCAAGIHGPWPLASGVQGHQYEMYVILRYTNGATGIIAVSPALTFSS